MGLFLDGTLNPRINFEQDMSVFTGSKSPSNKIFQYRHLYLHCYRLIGRLFPAMASIRKHPRSPFWFACYTLPDGRQTQRSTKIENKQANASRAMEVAIQYEKIVKVARAGRMGENQARSAIAAIYEIVNGEPLPGATIREYFQQWLGEKKKELSGGAYVSYRAKVKAVLDVLGRRADADLTHLDRKTILDVRDSLVDLKSVSTSNYCVKLVRAILRAAKHDGLIDTNEADGVAAIKIAAIDRVDKMPFTMPQVKALMAQADDEWRGMMLCALYAGMRLGDISMLQWGDINLSARRIEVKTRKTGRRINVPLAQPLYDYFNERQADDGPVFLRAHTVVEREGRTGNLSNKFKRLMARAGLIEMPKNKGGKKGRSAKRVFNPLTFHSFRHTATTLFKEAGVPHAVVMDIIGHDSDAVSRAYTHVGDDAKKDAVNMLPILE